MSEDMGCARVAIYVGSWVLTRKGVVSASARWLGAVLGTHPAWGGSRLTGGGQGAWPVVSGRTGTVSAYGRAGPVFGVSWGT